MFKINKVNWFMLAGLLFLFNLVPAVAQNSGTAPAELYSADMIKVYFFLIIVATIISRITQYLKLLLQWLVPKMGFMQAVYDWYWGKIKKRLQKNSIMADEQSVRPVLRKFIISVITYSAGILLGVFICVQFDLGILKYMGLAVPGKTLDAVLSGIAAGIGVEPVHSLFRLAEEKRRLKKLFSDVTAG